MHHSLVAWPTSLAPRRFTQPRSDRDKDKGKRQLLMQTSAAAGGNCRILARLRWYIRSDIRYENRDLTVSIRYSQHWPLYEAKSAVRYYRFSTSIHELDTSFTMYTYCSKEVHKVRIVVCGM